MTTARELMTRDPVTIAVSATVREAASLLFTLGFRHLPVIDDRKKLVGMVSDRDLRGFSVPYLVADEYVGGREALEAPVNELLYGGVASVRPDSDLADVVRVIGALAPQPEEGPMNGEQVIRFLVADAARLTGKMLREIAQREARPR